MLTRGPTPAGESYRVTRSTHVPVRVVAGSNPADAAKTFDDNELSRWASDGRADTAWIEYDFGRDVTLSEIELKLVGWRSRAYPLKLTLDGRDVWRGETERQLGYAAVQFPQARGRVLRITQTGAVQDRDAFGKIVELATARQAGDTGADAVPAGYRLAIVEADFHGPVGVASATGAAPRPAGTIYAISALLSGVQANGVPNVPFSPRAICRALPSRSAIHSDSASASCT